MILIRFPITAMLVYVRSQFLIAGISRTPPVLLLFEIEISLIPNLFFLRNEPPEAKILSVFAFKTSISFRKKLRKRVKTLKIFACGAQGR